jgi:hypothetical protein
MTDGAPTGPIVFSHPTVREFLRDHGAVLTFRAHERTTGETWWRESRTGPKMGDCRVAVEYEDIDPAGPEISAAYPMSGFDSPDAWRDAIRELHGDGELPDNGSIYRVSER